jgi:hypothetical protein
VRRHRPGMARTSTKTIRAGDDEEEGRMDVRDLTNPNIGNRSTTEIMRLELVNAFPRVEIASNTRQR